MGEWQEVSLGDLVTNHSASRRPVKSSERSSGPTPYYGASGIVDWVEGRTHRGEYLLVSEDGENLRSRSSPIAFVVNGPVWINNHAHVLRGREGWDTKFLEYALALTDVTGYLTGSAQPKLNRAALESIKLVVPRAPRRKAIAEVLGALDDQIAANDLVLSKAGHLAATSYERALARGARDVVVGEISEFHNRRRIPLSSRDRESRQGAVPYYGAAGRLDSVDEALFDRELVLVGEDGTVVRDDGRPVVQYIWGSAWVNNHAHVLTGIGISTELLRWAIERESVAHIVTGAVQPKISMGNLKSLAVSIPADASVVDIEVQQLAALVRVRSDENARLASTRDDLLPLLMSGKLGVKDAEKVVEEVV